MAQCFWTLLSRDGDVLSHRGQAGVLRHPECFLLFITAQQGLWTTPATSTKGKPGTKLLSSSPRVPHLKRMEKTLCNMSVVSSLTFQPTAKLGNAFGTMKDQ